MFAPKPAAEKSIVTVVAAVKFRNGLKMDAGTMLGLSVSSGSLVGVMLVLPGVVAFFMLSFGDSTAVVRLGVTGGLLPEGVPDGVEELEDIAAEFFTMELSWPRTAVRSGFGTR